MSSFGSRFRVTTAGESHSPAVTVIVEGVPSGMYLSLPRHIQPVVDRRRPGQSDLTTPRGELDTVEINSGIEQKPLMYYFDYVGGRRGHKSNAAVGKKAAYPLTSVLQPKPWLKDGEAPDISTALVSSLDSNDDENGTVSENSPTTPTPAEAAAIRSLDTQLLLADRTQGITLGTPLAFVVRNKDTRKQDYDFMTTESTAFVPRPSHGDLSYFLKYGGHVASSGGGRSSARETLARVIGGAVAQRVLWWISCGGKVGGRDEFDLRGMALTPLFLPLTSPHDPTTPPPEREGIVKEHVQIPSHFPRVAAFTLSVGGVGGGAPATSDGEVAAAAAGNDQGPFQINPLYPMVVSRSDLCHRLHLVPPNLRVTDQLLGLNSSHRNEVGEASSTASFSSCYTSLVNHRPVVEVTSRVPPSAETATADAAVRQAILEAGRHHDSVGGIVRCVIENCPAGLGEPVFDKFEALLGHAMMSIPASKGFLMGLGTGFSSARGSVVNDPYITSASGAPRTGGSKANSMKPELVTVTNHSGGTSGGISSGPGCRIYFDVIFKPPATIGIPQETCDSAGNPTTLEAAGRHDPCVVPRAVPVVEAMASIVLLDCILLGAANSLI